MWGSKKSINTLRHSAHRDKSWYSLCEHTLVGCCCFPLIAVFPIIQFSLKPTYRRGSLRSLTGLCLQSLTSSWWHQVKLPLRGFIRYKWETFSSFTECLCLKHLGCMWTANACLCLHIMDTRPVLATSATWALSIWRPSLSPYDKTAVKFHPQKSIVCSNISFKQKLSCW